MKFSITAAASLILLPPLGVLASPVPDPIPVPVPEGSAADIAPVAVEDDAEQSDADILGRDLFTRSQLICRIVNVDEYANCRSGPGTGFPVTHWAYRNVDYTFDCYRSGTCFNGNCSWQRLIWNNGANFCYVNGYLTDSRCTPAALGHC